MGSNPPESRNEIATQKLENQAAPAARLNNSDNLDFRTIWGCRQYATRPFATTFRNKKGHRGGSCQKITTTNLVTTNGALLYQAFTAAGAVELRFSLSHRAQPPREGQRDSLSRASGPDR
jgi:hypothetical protein